MTAPHDLVFLLDLDNTLLNNDQVITDLQGHLARHLGAANASRYWAIFEDLRSELGCAEYLGALQRYRLDAEATQHDDPCLLGMSSFFIAYPFADRLYAGAPARCGLFSHSLHDTVRRALRLLRRLAQRESDRSRHGPKPRPKFTAGLPQGRHAPRGRHAVRLRPVPRHQSAHIAHRAAWSQLKPQAR